MNIDNIVRTINKHLKDIFDAFGGASVEYIEALKQVKQNLPEDVLEKTARKGLDYEGDIPTEALQLSRSKNSKEILNNFESDLIEIRKEQRESGTVKKQKQKYIDDAIERGIDPDTIDFNEEAYNLYNFNNSTNDWYDAIMNDEDIDDDEKSIVRDLFSDLFENYDDPNFRDRLEEFCRHIMQEAEKRRENNDEDDEPVPPINDIGFDPSDDFGV